MSRKLASPDTPAPAPPPGSGSPQPGQRATGPIVTPSTRTVPRPYRLTPPGSGLISGAWAAGSSAPGNNRGRMAPSQSSRPERHCEPANTVASRQAEPEPHRVTRPCDARTDGGPDYPRAVITSPLGPRRTASRRARARASREPTRRVALEAVERVSGRGSSGRTRSLLGCTVRVVAGSRARDDVPRVSARGERRRQAGEAARGTSSPPGPPRAQAAAPVSLGAEM